MKRFNGATIALLTVLAIGATASSAAAKPTRHVVDASEIQARIDQCMDKETADRQAIQLMLQRSDVRAIAGQAGLDIDRAGAAAAVLSGAELETLAAQASAINAGVGGGNNVVISTTAIIIILLVLILVT